MAEVRVTQAGAYGELDGTPSVYVTEVGVYAEVEERRAIVTQAGVYAEIEEHRAVVTVAGSYGEFLPLQTIVVDGLDLTPWITNYELVCEDVAVLTITFSSTAKTMLRDVHGWTVTAGGMWSSVVDNLLAPRYLRGNMRHNLEVWFDGVQYSWSAQVGISSYEVDAQVGGVATWSMTLHCNGVPTRHVYTAGA